MTSPPRNLSFGPISAAAPGPLYEQLVAAVKREVAAGRLSPGDSLPSLRVLAGDLLVSLITVKRAYEELEREGVIYSRQGLGAFVAEAGVQAVRDDRAAAARTALAAAIAAGREAGLEDGQIRTMLQQELDRGKTT
ncbi:MAG: GntR family transcriptional regulator [Caulobacteraceae bacterium]|nr:GntR family transcriptional regulator [Caulobacteraceae bacterium]